MHRFHLPPEKCRGAMLVLTDNEAHHAARVLRVQTGETVTVLDGAGGEFRCEISNVGKREVQLRVLERKVHPAPPCQITLLQAIPKGKIIESIIEKATELGVHRIVPLLTERVTTRLDDEGAADKGAKWRQVAVEAIKQCGAPWLPKVETPVTLKEFVARGERHELALIASLQANAKSMRFCFQEFLQRQGRLPESVCIWIGPEGDLTPGEYDLIQASGALPITLGRLVLRVDTAAVVCLAILNHELDEKSRNQLQ